MGPETLRASGVLSPDEVRQAQEAMAVLQSIQAKVQASNGDALPLPSALGYASAPSTARLSQLEPVLRQMHDADHIELPEPQLPAQLSPSPRPRVSSCYDDSDDLDAAFELLEQM